MLTTQSPFSGRVAKEQVDAELLTSNHDFDRVEAPLRSNAFKFSTILVVGVVNGESVLPRALLGINGPSAGILSVEGLHETTWVKRRCSAEPGARDVRRRDIDTRPVL